MEVLTLWRCAVRQRSAGLNLAPLVSCCQLFSEEDTVVFVLCTGSGTPASCLGVACGASERMCLQRNYSSVEWPTLSGRAKLREELPWFFISAVRFSFLESCLELSLNKYAKFPVWIACREAILKGVRGLGKFFSLSGVWCEVGTHLESGWELPAEPPGRQGEKSCPSNQPLSPCSFVLQPGWFPQCTGSLGLRGDSRQLAHSAF